jgi:hypothetical protein
VTKHSTNEEFQRTPNRPKKISFFWGSVGRGGGGWGGERVCPVLLKPIYMGQYLDLHDLVFGMNIPTLGSPKFQSFLGMGQSKRLIAKKITKI